MLTDLVTQGLGVIERAELNLAPGCTSLTGETGAGKTLVVAALGLLAGGRAERSIVRAGAAEARVEGRFSVTTAHPAVDFLVAHGVLDDAHTAERVEIVVTRTVPADGRPSKARINGRLVPISLVAGAGRSLVEIAGQHEHQHLGRSSVQRSLLDAFAGERAVGLARAVSETARRVAKARGAIERLRTSERERARQLDVLAFEIDEIESAALRRGESEELAERARRLERAGAAAGAINEAMDRVTGDAGALESLAGAANALARIDDSDLADLTARLQAARWEIEEVGRELAGKVLDSDPVALDEIHQRLSVVARLKRKYGVDEAGVLSYLESAGMARAELERAEEESAQWAEELEQQTRRAHELATELTALRAEAAPRLQVEVEGVLAELALAGARFRVSLTPRTLYDGGLETVDFLFSADGGQAPQPIAKVASGGELARLALALHLLTRSGGASTLVFDEVDAGVGGQAARAVGRAVAAVARTTGAQVLVVTHLPQVAASADHHFTVTKNERGAALARVEGDERVNELSRMLAGLPESDRARHHAQELLQLAERDRDSPSVEHVRFALR